MAKARPDHIDAALEEIGRLDDYVIDIVNAVEIVAAAALFVVSAWCWFQVDFGSFWPVMAVLLSGSSFRDLRAAKGSGIQKLRSKLLDSGFAATRRPGMTRMC